MPRVLKTIALQYPADEMMEIGGVTQERISQDLEKEGVSPLPGSVEIGSFGIAETGEFGFQATWRNWDSTPRG